MELMEKQSARGKMILVIGDINSDIEKCIHIAKRQRPKYDKLATALLELSTDMLAMTRTFLKNYPMDHR